MVRIKGLKAFSDNYLWLMQSDAHAVVVDPGDAQVVRLALEQASLSLDAILLTHHHQDHTGGVADLVALTGAQVYGPAAESIPGVTWPLEDGDRIQALGHAWEVLAVPGHTRGHIAYWSPDLKTLFCGDTLFGAGCGRLFEGTPQQMWNSLSRLAELPPETQVYCAHEYTMSNLKFARMAEPLNLAIADREQISAKLRLNGEPTVPFSIAIELATNPFIRSANPEIADRATAMAAVPEIRQQIPDLTQLPQPIRTLATLRAWKNIA